MKTLLGALLFATLLLAGCKKDEAKVEAPKADAVKAPEAAKPAEGEAAKPAAAAADSWVNLDKLGAKIQMPAGAKAEESSGDAPGYTVAPEDYGYTVMVNTATEAYASTYEAAVGETKKLTNGFKDFSKNEKTADGWVLEFEGESMMDKSPLYGVVVRKKVGDKSIECSRNENSKEARDRVSKACQSITKI